MSSAEEHLAETGEGHPDDAKRYTVEKHATKRAFVNMYTNWLIYRIFLGENTIGLPVRICLPGCTLIDGVYIQTAPVRTVAMVCSFTTTLVFSWLAAFMFNHRLLPQRWDVLKVKHKEAL